MPGGKDYRRWYAMRQRLITEQRWNTRTREIRVPPAKQPRLGDESPPTSPSMPELESTDSEPEGILFLFYRWLAGRDRQASLYSYGVVICRKDIQKNEKYY